MLRPLPNSLCPGPTSSTDGVFYFTLPCLPLSLNSTATRPVCAPWQVTLGSLRSMARVRLHALTDSAPHVLDARITDVGGGEGWGFVRVEKVDGQGRKSGRGGGVGGVGLMDTLGGGEDEHPWAVW